MKFILEIGLGIETMQTRTDLERCLRNTRELRMGEQPEDGDDGPIVDENGNTVGKWRVMES